MAIANGYVQQGDIIDYYNSGSTEIAYHTVIPATNIILVASQAIPASTNGGAYFNGVFDFPAINTVAMNVGDKVYWDDTAGKITNVSTSNTPAGTVVATKAQTGAIARVKINR